MREEVAIVGAGIVGASIAAHVSARIDRPVRVYERRAELADGTTTTSLATWRTTPPPTASDPIHQMKRYSLAYYNDLVAGSDRETWFELVGQLEVATTGKGSDSLREGATSGQDTPATQGDEFLSPAELERTVYCPDLATDEITGARYRPYLGYFDPDALTTALAREARANGATFHTGVDVTDLHTDGQRVTGITADGQSISTAAVISAAGPGTAQLMDCVDLGLPVRYTTGYTMRVEPARPLSIRLPKLDHYESPVGFRGTAEREAIIYQTGPTADVADYYDAGSSRPSDEEESDLPETVAEEFHATAEQLLPPVGEGTVIETDTAPLSRTPDSRPILGWSPRPGLLLAALHAAGIQLAPAIGQIVATQLVGGDESLPHDAVSIGRFDGYEPVPAPID